MNPVRAAIGRPVTVTVLCLAAVVVGLVGAGVIPLQLLPDGFEANGMTLILPYPNADPWSVERDVARPVEEALATVEGLRKIEIDCSAEQARVSLEFGGKVDMAMASLEVRDRLDRIRASLPREAQRFRVRRHVASNFPDMAFGALIPEGMGIEGFQLIERRLLPHLGRVDGVAAVDTWGGLIDRVAYIELDEDRVRAHRVDMRDLVSRLSTENFHLPAGPIQDGGQRMLVRTAAPFQSLDDLARYPVDRQLTIGDIGEAVVRLGYRDDVSRMDGRDIVWVVVRKESGRNTVEVCRAVREAAATIGSDPALAGVELLPLWDAGQSVEAALSELIESVLWGGLLAVLVLFAFLRELRATLVIAAAIPFSVLVALAVLTASGYSLNVLTLAGLTLAVGMLVDNAIVVVENVVRRRELGESPDEAAGHGAGEVALAITLATATSIVVFLPLVFVSDEPRVRVMISNLAGPISFGLGASLITALLVVPLLAARLKTGRVREGPARGPITWLRERTVAMVEWTLAHRVETAVALVLAVGLSGQWLATKVERRGEEGGIQESIRVRVSLDASVTLAEANAIFSKYEEILIPRRAELGSKHVQVRFDRGGGSVEMRLLPSEEREPLETLRERLREVMPELPGAKLGFGGFEEEGGEFGARVRVALIGPETEVLYPLAEELVERLRASGGFDEVDEVVGEGTREVRVVLDREAVARAGAVPNAVLGTLGYQLRGSRLRDLRLGGLDIPLIVNFGDPPGGGSLAWLRAMPVATASGAQPLEALATVTTGRGPRSITRIDRKTQVSVTARAPRSQAWRSQLVAEQVMATFPLPEGVSYEIGGSFEGFDQQVQEIFKVLLLGVAFVFLLTGVLFESFILPLAILPSLPFAFVGAYLALWLTDTPQDVIATLGSVVLAGIVVNNAIVLVDAINRGLAAGLPQREAIVTGVRDRFRPVLLTAATTVIGLLPMAWTPATEGVLSYHSLARAVIGGLCVSTAGTLLAVPLLWALLDDARRYLLGIMSRYWTSAPPADVAGWTEPATAQATATAPPQGAAGPAGTAGALG